MGSYENKDFNLRKNFRSLQYWQKQKTKNKETVDWTVEIETHFYVGNIRISSIFVSHLIYPFY